MKKFHCRPREKIKTKNVFRNKNCIMNYSIKIELIISSENRNEEPLVKVLNFKLKNFY